MLHGYTQSGPLFRAKTRALEKSLLKYFPAPTYALSLHYPTAPINIKPADLPGFDPTTSTSDGRFDSSVTAESTDAWGWWVRKGEREPYTYDGMETGFARVAEVLKTEGPFDGVIGFSQGGALAGMVASLLETGRKEAFERAQAEGGMAYPSSFLEEDTGYVEGDTIHAPLRFAVSYSGFGASTNPLYQAFYEPKIATPMLHFLGQVDTVVEEARSLRLVDACVEGRGEGDKRVVYHPGGHFLPSSQKQYVAALAAFMMETMGWDETRQAAAAQKAGKSEESLDDFPF